MAHVKEDKNTYLAHFDRFEQGGAASDWFLPARKTAMARFTELGFPTTKDEDWRYTNVAPIAKIAFERADRSAIDGVTAAQIARLAMADAVGGLLVFINGHFARDLSIIDSLSAGLHAGSLAAAVESGDAVVKEHLGKHTDSVTQAFAALNTAIVEDGAVIRVESGKKIERPIHVLYLSTSTASPFVSHPRNLIVVGECSEVTVIENYVGLDGAKYFANAVTEIVVGDGAIVDHYNVQREADEAFHIGTRHVRLGRDSCATSHTLSMGGKLVRNNVGALLAGEGAECTLNGLYTIDGEQHVDNHLRVDHAVPHCDSREFYKGILEGRSHGVFCGRIMVREDAQKTDAKQTNMSLLLSEEAQVDSKPQLEIFADDVKCTHGATIGQVDEDALFYLQSRGISAEAARSLLIYAFAKESVSKIKVDALREQLDALLLARLPQGASFRESA